MKIEKIISIGRIFYCRLIHWDGTDDNEVLQYIEDKIYSYELHRIFWRFYWATKVNKKPTK